MTVLLCVPIVLVVMTAHWVIFRKMWAGDSNEYDSIFGAAAFVASDLVAVSLAVFKLAKRLRLHGAGECEIVGVGMVIALVLGLVYVLVSGSSIIDAASYRWRFTAFSSVVFFVSGLLYASIRKPVLRWDRWLWGWFGATGVLMLPILASSFWKPSHDMTLWALVTWLLNAAAALCSSLFWTRRRQ